MHHYNGIRSLRALIGDTSGKEEFETSATLEKLGLILPRITAVISLLAVVGVAMEAWSDLRATRNATSLTSSVSGNRIRSSSTSIRNLSAVTQIQLFYQFTNFIYYLALAMGSTPAPKGSVWGAAGSIATCEAQGFLVQFGTFAYLGWDAALSGAYLMMVRYNVADLRLQCWGKYCHFIIWPSALALAIYPLTKDMYNPNHNTCWSKSCASLCCSMRCALVVLPAVTATRPRMISQPFVS